MLPYNAHDAPGGTGRYQGWFLTRATLIFSSLFHVGDMLISIFYQRILFLDHGKEATMEMVYYVWYRPTTVSRR